MSSPSTVFTTSYSIVALVGERILAAEEEQQNSSNSNSTVSLNSTITDDDGLYNSIDENSYTLDEQQLLTGVIAPRISGFIILISSLFMLYMSWKRRYRLFHRLVFGMSFYLFLIGICFLVGTAAIPTGTDYNAIGNIGTITTCTIQGFLIHLGSMISISYYCCFSVYSYVGVLHNFEKNKISWIEKYIHIGVHVYPISSAIYLAYIEGLNSTGIGFCHIGSSLLGCSGWFESRQDEDDTGIDDDKCDRGPEELTIIRYTLWSLPLLLCLFCTTTTMILLYLKVKQKQDQIYIHSNTVAYQSIIYLSALYVTLLPLLLTHLVILLRGTNGFSNEREHLFALMVFVYLEFSLFSLWTMLTYRYFSIEHAIDEQQPQQNDPPLNSTATTKACQQQKQTNTPSGEEREERTKNTSSITDHIFSSHEFPPNSTTSATLDSSSRPTLGMSNKEEGKSKNNFTPPRQAYSFNIFDGTNASGTFADFVHSGDSDDENIDNEQTIYWTDVQNHV